MAVTTASALVALMGFAALAVDVGYFYVERSRLQTAADLAALAGAGAMIAFGNDVSMQPTCAQTAVTFARANLKPDEKPLQAINTEDVTFMLNGTPNTANPNQIEVVVTCSAARGNPVRTFFAAALGITDTDISATARAEVMDVCGTRCLKPFIAPLDFTWDDVNDNGAMDFDNPDEVSSCQSRLWNENDFYTQMTVKYGDPADAKEEMAPGLYSLIALSEEGVDRGGSEIRDNIGHTCANTDLVGPGSTVMWEPGNKIGPVLQGFDALFAKDPLASWDTSTNTIINSVYADDPMASPRVGFMAFYDPCTTIVDPGRDDVIVAQVAAMFFEDVVQSGKNKSEATARLVPAEAIDGSGTCLGPMLRTIRLVR